MRSLAMVNGHDTAVRTPSGVWYVVRGSAEKNLRRERRRLSHLLMWVPTVLMVTVPYGLRATGWFSADGLLFLTVILAGLFGLAAGVLARECRPRGWRLPVGAIEGARVSDAVARSLTPQARDRVVAADAQLGAVLAEMEVEERQRLDREGHQVS